MKLFQIRGLSENSILQYSERFYNEHLMNHIINPLYERFIEHIKNGDHVLIVSGGYFPYLRKFSEQHNIQTCFGTNLEFKKGKLTGCFLGEDCLYDEKVIRLNKYLTEKGLKYGVSIAYTDSITDLPLLKWANRGVVVSKNTPQQWVEKQGFEQIVWKNDWKNKK